MNDLSAQEWLTFLGLILTVGSVPTVILFLLQRKGANKKLQIEEGALGVTVFEAQTKTYKELLERADKATSDALEELKAYREERKGMLKRIDDLEASDNDKAEKLERIRRLFTAYTTRVGAPMTAEERQIFDETVPSIPRIRAARQKKEAAR